MNAIKKALNWEYLSWARDRFGALFAIAHWRRRLVCIPTGKDQASKVFLRPGTADQIVYDEVFRAAEYDIPLGNPKFIIDAGAHIGLASVYFALRYPDARIIAIEPEASNFAVLSRHARMYPNIIPVKAGLWNKETRLKVSNPGGETWSFRVEESPDGFDAVTVDGIMRRFGVEHVDVLKIDIEGSEVEVLSHAGSWIANIGALIIELHDRFKPGCRQTLESAVDGLSWNRSVSGESLVLVRS